MPKMRATLLLLLATVLLAPECAVAVEFDGPCDAPTLFPDAALNVVVLPYSQPKALPLADDRVGQRLAALVELEALLTVVKFGSVGLVQLVGNDEKCATDVVFEKLHGQLKSGRGLILVWGRIFQAGDDLYVQSYLRFLRRNVAETIELPIAGRRLSGRLTSQAWACPPRKVSLRDLQGIQQQFAGSRLLRSSPDDKAAFVTIPEGSGPYSFSILGVRGDWVQLQPTARRQTLPTGWLRARSENTQWPLRNRMPELGLVEGIGGYLAARVSSNVPPDALGAADAALAQYLARWKDGALIAAEDAAKSGVTLAVAVPEQLRGFIALERGAISNDALTAAADHFTKAADILPYSGDARNLAIMTRLALALQQAAPSQSASQSAHGYVESFLAAVGTEPTNPVVLANLETLYDLVLAPGEGDKPRLVVTAGERETYQRQREALHRIPKPSPAKP